MTPLWEFDHPYYCSESNYFSNDCYSQYESWESFVDEQGELDFDMNLVFRWDWNPNEHLGDETAEARREYAARFGDRDHAWTLSVFWMGQRKGLFRCTDVKVCKANEPAVRAWLAQRAEHMRLLWEPLLTGPARSVLGEKR